MLFSIEKIQEIEYYFAAVKSTISVSYVLGVITQDFAEQQTLAIAKVHFELLEQIAPDLLKACSVPDKTTYLADSIRFLHDLKRKHFADLN